MFTTGLATTILRQIQPSGDDDFADRLNYFYSTAIIVIGAVFISAKQYVGRPIQCWVPQQFSRPMEEYIESYCWMQNTYWIPLHANIPDEIARRDELQIGYYQWTPFILILQAVLFYFPNTVWRLVSWQAGINMQVLIQRSRQAASINNPRERQEAVEYLAQSFEDLLNIRTFFSPLRHARKLVSIDGALLNFCYLFCKAMYTANVIGQFFLLNYFLCPEKTTLYGIEVLSDLVRGFQWSESGHFPRVTLCDFEVKYLGNLNRYTVQCALIGNLFNEKIFAILWCWYTLVSFVTVFSFVYWILNTFFKTKRNVFIQQYLDILGDKTRLHAVSTVEVRGAKVYPDSLCDRFIRRFLRIDGVFILRRLAANAGDLVCMELVQILWLKFLNQEYEIQRDLESGGGMISSTPLVLSELMNLYAKEGPDSPKIPPPTMSRQLGSIEKPGAPTDL